MFESLAFTPVTVSDAFRVLQQQKLQPETPANPHFGPRWSYSFRSNEWDTAPLQNTAGDHTIQAVS